MSLAGLVCAGEPATCDDVLKGPQWLHEIKLDRFRTAARIDHGRAQLLTRTRQGLAGDIGRRPRENDRNSLRRPRPQPKRKHNLPALQPAGPAQSTKTICAPCIPALEYGTPTAMSEYGRAGPKTASGP
jgi:hypothetical protein